MGLHVYINTPTLYDVYVYRYTLYPQTPNTRIIAFYCLPSLYGQLVLQIQVYANKE